jgi:hypothetical protein|tara:strand:- start:290 stop:907 length:618 start_codon:yes stop_codon:yes gene_type:complete
MYRFDKKIDAAAHSSRVIARARPIIRASSAVNSIFNVARILSSGLRHVTAFLSNTEENVTRSLAPVERSLQGRLAHDRRVEDDQCTVTIANRSVVVRTLERLILSPVMAWRGGRLRVLNEVLAQLEISERMRLTGVWLSAVLVAQTIAVSVAGVSIHLVSWGVRCGLAAICLLLCFRPHLVATAWIARWPGDARPGLQNQSKKLE